MRVRYDRIIAPRLALHNICREYSILGIVRKEERNYRTEETGYVTSEINLFHNNKYYGKKVAPAGVGRTRELKRLHVILVTSDV